MNDPTPKSVVPKTAVVRLTPATALLVLQKSPMHHLRMQGIDLSGPSSQAQYLLHYADRPAPGGVIITLQADGNWFASAEVPL